MTPIFTTVSKYPAPFGKRLPCPATGEEEDFYAKGG
jgi:hypothetical protein